MHHAVKIFELYSTIEYLGKIETESKNTFARLSGACPACFESLKKTKGRKFSDALPLRGQSHKNNFLTETLICYIYLKIIEVRNLDHC